MRNVATKLTMALGAVVVSATMASAQPAGLTFNGTTAGCFGAGCTPSNVGGSLFNLLYFPGTFSTTTDVNGLAPIGGAITGNLGEFALTAPVGAPDNYNGQTFNLQVNIVAPPTVPGSLNFTALLSGVVQSSGNGVQISFNNTTQPFSFVYNSGPNMGMTGTGTFSVPSFVSVNAGEGRATLTGTIRATAVSTVPEPSTYMLLASGMGALGLIARRRRNNV